MKSLFQFAFNLRLTPPVKLEPAPHPACGHPLPIRWGEPRPELDLLLVDIDRPGLSGADLIARITAPVKFSCLVYTFATERR